jgi:hypothetical protein
MEFLRLACLAGGVEKAKRLIEADERFVVQQKNGRASPGCEDGYSQCQQQEG